MSATVSIALPVNDRTLVRRAQQGDRDAFDRLVRKYHARVLQLALRHTRSLPDAEDAAQEAFLQAYRGLPRFRGECAFYTWLYRIALNSARNVLAVRHRQAAVMAPQPLEADQDGELSAQVADNETPEHLAISDEICSRVDHALAALPEQQRIALLMRELEGRSYESIAQFMACPLGTVRSRIFRARELIDAQLRQVFDQGLGREHCAGRATI